MWCEVMNGDSVFAVLGLCTENFSICLMISRVFTVGNKSFA